MKNSYGFYRRVMVLLFALLAMSKAQADIVFNFSGNHALHGKATAELRLKDRYQFGKEMTAGDLVSFKFRSKKHQFTIRPKEILTIYAALNEDGTLANSAGNYQFYLDAAGGKFFGLRTNGTWRAKSDAHEGTMGSWKPAKKTVKHACLQEDRFFKAASRGDVKYVKQCLASGVPVNSKESKGWTALHSAAYNGQIEVIRLLLKKGAKKSAKDQFGRTAGDYAVKNKQYDAAAVLVLE